MLDWEGVTTGSEYVAPLLVDVDRTKFGHIIAANERVPGIALFPVMLTGETRGCGRAPCSIISAGDDAFV